MRFRRAAALLILTASLAACDLPGAHQNDAVVVNGHAVPRSDYDHLVDVTTQQLRQRVPLDANSPQGQQQVRNLQIAALRVLVRQEVIQELATKHNVSVSESDLDSQVAQLKTTLGGDSALNQRLDQSAETITDLRHTIKINLLQQKLRGTSNSYDGEYNKAVDAADVTAYVPPCDGNHAWPQCADGKR